MRGVVLAAALLLVLGVANAASTDMETPPAHFQQVIGDAFLASVSGGANMDTIERGVNLVQRVFGRSRSISSTISAILPGKDMFRTLDVAVHRLVYRRCSTRTLVVALKRVAPLLTDLHFDALKDLENLCTESGGGVCAQGVEDTGEAQESQVSMAYSTPSGLMQLAFLAWSPAADGRWAFILLHAKTAFKIAPDIVVRQNTLSKSSFLKSTSVTTTELQELERHLTLEETNSIGQSIFLLTATLQDEALRVLGIGE